MKRKLDEFMVGACAVGFTAAAVMADPRPVVIIVAVAFVRIAFSVFEKDERKW